MRNIGRIKPRKIFWMIKPDSSWFSEYSKLSIAAGPDKYDPDYFEVKGGGYKKRFKTIRDAANHILNLEGITEAVDHTFAGKLMTGVAKNDHSELHNRLYARLKFVLRELAEDYTDPELRDFNDLTPEQLETIVAALKKPILYDRLVATLDKYFEELKHRN